MHVPFSNFDNGKGENNEPTAKIEFLGLSFRMPHKISDLPLHFSSENLNLRWQFYPFSSSQFRIISMKIADSDGHYRSFLKNYSELLMVFDSSVIQLPVGKYRWFSNTKELWQFSFFLFSDICKTELETCRNKKNLAEYYFCKVVETGRGW